MANNSKTFTIGIAGDLSSFEKTMEAAETLLKGFSGNVSGGFVKLDEKTKAFNATMQVTLKNLEDFKRLQEKIKTLTIVDNTAGSFPALDSSGSGYITNIKAGLGEIDKQRAEITKKASEESLRIIKAEVEAEVAIIREGSNSIRAIKLQEAEALRQAEFKRNAAFKDLDTSKSNVNLLAQGNAIDETYKKEILAAHETATEKLKALEVEKAGRAKDVEAFQEYLNRRLVLLQGEIGKEVAIIKSGADSLAAADAKRRDGLAKITLNRDAGLDRVSSSGMDLSSQQAALDKILDNYKKQQLAIEEAYAKRVSAVKAQESLEKDHAEALKINSKLIADAEKKRIKEQADLEKSAAIESLRLYQEATSNKLAILNSALAKEKALTKEGVNSVTAIRIEEAEKLRQLKADLATKLNSIGSANLPDTAKDTFSTAAIAKYEDRVKALTVITDAQTAAALRNISAQEQQNAAWLKGIRDVENLRLEQLKLTETAQISDFRKRVAMQKAVEQDGVNGIAAIKERQRQLEAEAEIRLVNRLAQIRKDAEAGVISASSAEGARNRILLDQFQLLERIRQAGRARLETANEVKSAEERLKNVLAEQLRLKEAADAKKGNSLLNRIINPTAQVNAPDVSLKATNPALYIDQLKAYTDQIHRTNLRTQEAESSHQSWVSRIAGSMIIYQALRSILSKVEEGIMNIPQAGIRMESSLASLTAVTGNLIGAEKQMFDFRAEAERTGIPIQALMKSFNQFAPSAINAGEKLSTIIKIFRDVNTAATTLHKTQDEVDGIFLALAQIFSKGKLQAEELVKQLAQRVPGAVSLMALAYAKAGEDINHATIRLQKDMKAGLVTPHQLVSEFGTVLEQKFGGVAFERASSGMQASLGRLSTSWELLSEAGYKSTSTMLIDITKWVTGSLEQFRLFIEEGDSLDKSLTTVKATIVALAGSAGVLYLVKSMQTLMALEVVQRLGFFNAAATTLSTTLKGVGSFIAANSVGIGLVALLAAASAVYVKWQQIQETAERIAKNVKDIQDAETAAAGAKSSPEAQVNFDISKSEKVIEAQKMYNEAAQQTLDIQERIALAQDVVNNKILNVGVGGFSPAVEAAKAALKDLNVNLTNSQENEAFLFKKYLESRAVARKDLLDTEAKMEQETAKVITDEQLGMSQRQFEFQTKLLDDSTKAVQAASQEKQSAIREEAATQENLLKTQLLSAKSSAEQGIINSKLLAVKHDMDVKMQTEKIRLELELQKVQSEGAKLVSKQIGEQITDNDKLFAAVMKHESQFKKSQVSPVGALGLGQIMPSTAKAFMPIPQDILALEISAKAFQDAANKGNKAKKYYTLPEAIKRPLVEFVDANQAALLESSKQYFAQLMDRYNGNIPKVLAAYNAGPWAVDKAVKSFGENFLSGLTKETRDYVPTVLKYYDEKGKTGDLLDKYTQATMESEVRVREESGKTATIQSSYALAQATLQKDLTDKRIAQEEAFAQKIEELNAQIDGLRGGKQASAEAQIEVAYLRERKSLLADKEKGIPENTKALELLKTRRSLQLEQAKTIDLEAKQSIAREAFQMREQEIANLKATGYISEQQAIAQLTEARKAYTEEAERYVVVLEKAAELEGNPQKALKAKEARMQLSQVRYPNAGAANNYIQSQIPNDYQQYQRDQNNLSQGLAQELDIASKSVLAEEAKQQEILRIREKYATAGSMLNANYYSGIAGLAADAFSGITESMIKMYGAESEQARIAFALYKANATAKVIMSTAVAVMAAMEVPPPMGTILAGLAAAMGAAQIAQIVSQPMPQAHGGLEYVPENATYKLTKGERVLAPGQNKQLMQTINNISNSSGKAVKIVNVGYGDDFRKYLTSTEGESIIVNHMTRNSESLI
jgi:tape measure domain-containing protein